MAKHVEGRHVFQSFGVGTSLGVLIWQELDPRIFGLIGASLMVFEFFIQLRWRFSIPCRDCGFDPVLYLRNPEAACEKVKVRLAVRKTDPLAPFSKKTPLRVPVRRVPAGELVP